MPAGKKLKDALKSLGFPVARIVLKVAKGQEKPPTYFTFKQVLGLPVGFADDDNTARESTWMVDLFSKTDYTALLERLEKAVKDADFFAFTIETEDYETRTGYYHVPVQIKYLED